MTFVDLMQRWSQIRISLPTKEIEKYLELLAFNDERQVRSSFDLLMSVDSSALCEVLREVNGLLWIREDVVQHHHLLWAQCIFEEVMDVGSDWYELYIRDCFRSLEVRIYGSRYWDDLSGSQQNQIIQESLRSVDIHAGTFMMGALPNDKKPYKEEKPRHKVRLTKGMKISVFMCTQGLYTSVTGSIRSRFREALKPVDEVSWCDAVLFCNKLSQREGLEPCYIFPEPFKNDDEWSTKVQWNRSANGYRLPTEAEWEYCARGGEEQLYSGSNNVNEVAWYSKNSARKTRPVGEKKANGFGLYDMSGNLWEWVWDTYDAEAYKRGSVIDPITDKPSPRRVTRGGGSQFKERKVRVSVRSWCSTSYRNTYHGFRFLRTI